MCVKQYGFVLIIFLTCFLFASVVYGGDPGLGGQESGAQRMIVILPERMETHWYWYYIAENVQHLVQNQVEQALIEQGYEVIDLHSMAFFQGIRSIEDVLKMPTAVDGAKKAGASYLIVGYATASELSSSVAYGVRVVRSGADVTLKVVRVHDGCVLAALSEEAQGGGESQRGAGQDALKEVGKKMSDLLIETLEQVLGGR